MDTATVTRSCRCLCAFFIALRYGNMGNAFAKKLRSFEIGSVVLC
jgi:hypothetical protein